MAWCVLPPRARLPDPEFETRRMTKTLAAADEDAAPFGGARTAREAERREAFMRTAAGVFRQHGLAGATMEQVAAAAG